MRLKLQRSHHTCQVANKCLNNLEQLNVVDRNEYGPLPTPAVPQIISVGGKTVQIQKRTNQRSFELFLMDNIIISKMEDIVVMENCYT